MMVMPSSAIRSLRRIRQLLERRDVSLQEEPKTDFRPSCAQRLSAVSMHDARVLLPLSLLGSSTVAARAL
jgi:hypothetical protein